MARRRVGWRVVEVRFNNRLNSELGAVEGKVISAVGQSQIREQVEAGIGLGRRRGDFNGRSELELVRSKEK